MGDNKMKYKGINKIYFGIGIERYYPTITQSRFYFYCFKLKQKNPEGEMLKKGRDYTGICFEKKFNLPNLGIHY